MLSARDYLSGDMGMKIDASTRLLFFAPHPDDESLAGGALLQRAAAAGAQVQVVFATNGDNNPWPHRVLQRRWKIEVGDQMLWGMRRAQEALDALHVLGLPASCAEFLHLPDQRVTELFFRRDPEMRRRISKIIEDARPTLLVAPGPFDLHPDHSAFHLLVRQACLRAACAPPEQFFYAVHTRGYHSDWAPAELRLTTGEQAVKRRAILCHSSQMLLSRKRFLAHVTPAEHFWKVTAPRETDLHHPVRGARLEDGVLLLQLQRRKRVGSFARCSLLLAVESGLTGRPQRWILRLPRKSGTAPLRDAASGAEIGVAAVLLQGVHAEVRLALPRPAAITQIFAKLQQPSLFFDVAGWRELPHVEVSAPLRRIGAEKYPRIRRRRLLALGKA